MGILNIQPATRAGAHLLIQLYGGPRSGKTMTALRLARGMVGPAGKIGFLDTESGRARLYSDKIEGGFFVGELTPQFTPERYRLSIEEFLAFKVDVLVIDSFSMCWDGTGGVLEMAELAEKGGARGLQKWLKPKVEYRKLIGFLLSTRMHVILCSRAKQPMIEATVDGKKTLTPGPWEPIQDKRLRYEMTIVLPMTLDGTYDTDPLRMKTPGDLAGLFDGKLLTEETGAKIAAWVGGAQVIDHDAELLLKQAGDAARDGVEALRAFFGKRSRPEQKILKAQEENLKSIAKAADEAKGDAAGDGDDSVGGQQTVEDDKHAADPFAGRKEPETPPAKTEEAPVVQTGRFPPAPTTGDWTDWMHAARKIADEAADTATLADLDLEFRKIAGIPDVVHGTVARAIRDRSKTLKGK